MRGKIKKNSLILPGDEKHAVNKTTDSAVAISISSVSHHRKIKKSSPTSSLEIIIADDNRVSFLVLKFILEKLNVILHHARNGIEAVNMVKNFPNIDLVLMDIKMPLMNGIEATKQVRMIAPELPIIAQSAFSDDIDILGLFQAGCDDFISKPVDPKLLLSKIICWNF